ncbi:MAG: phosphate ABC transporter permease subunit PstC [Magnetospiraceae bacterium]
MNALIIVLAILLLSGYGFYLGRGRSVAVSGGDTTNLHSRPNYYGLYVALWCGIPALMLMIAWMIGEPILVESLVVSGLSPETQNLPPEQLGLVLNDVFNLARGNITSGTPSPEVQAAADHFNSLNLISRSVLLVLVLAMIIGLLNWARKQITPHLRARNETEKVIQVLLVLCSVVAILTTFGIVLSLLFESFRFFQKVPVTDFLFGLEWSPQTALRKDQVGSSGLFGAIPLMAGTLLISFIAMCIAAPVGLLAAVYLSEYAAPKVRAVTKPLLEILAGIPTVVYGFFAALTVAPFMRDTGGFLGLDISSESALAAGGVMGIMIIPFVSSLSDDVITAVPRAMREGSYGLGATQSETILRVILPAALPGIVGGVLLAVSRAIGETMIVVMAAGLAANLTANPFEAVTTVTVQIVTLLVGDQEFDSAKTLAAFALGLTLFCVTLVLNVIALTIVNKYREQYE